MSCRTPSAEMMPSKVAAAAEPHAGVFVGNLAASVGEGGTVAPAQASLAAEGTSGTGGAPTESANAGAEEARPASMRLPWEVAYSLMGLVTTSTDGKI